MLADLFFSSKAAGLTPVPIEAQLPQGELGYINEKLLCRLLRNMSGSLEQLQPAGPVMLKQGSKTSNHAPTLVWMWNSYVI